MKRTFKIFILAVVLLLAWEVKNIYFNKTHVDETERETTIADKEETTTANQDSNKSNLSDGTKVTLVATGDNFMHESVIESGKQADGTYNYDYIFKGISKYIDAADISILNQASVIGGNSLGISGYPTFNSPEEICDAVLKAKFNVVLMASNRVNSMGTEAIKNCINIWNQKASSIQVMGINKDKEDADNNIKIIETNGVKIAMLNYTYGLNTKLSTDDLYLVDFLCAVNESTGEISESILSSKVLNDIKIAKEKADFVVVFPCWGDEYEYVANDIQKKFADEMVEAGANLIIGTHPHYLQNVEWIESSNGNKGLCYYSLGNLISSQNYAGTMLGGLAKVNLVVENGEVKISNEGTGLVPIVTQYTYSGSGDLADMVGIIPYSEYTEELALAHGIKERGGVSFSMSELQFILNTFINKDLILE